MDFPKSTPSVGLVDGKFVDEDQVAGTPGSLIPAQWGNAVTEELLNVIESASLTPDEDNNAQLLAAINAKITAAIPVSPPDASTTVKGLVELATDAETQTGTDAQRAVTPAGLASRTATQTRAGIVELATAAETQTGTDALRAVTPAGLASIATTSALDSTTGRLARIGDFGLGGIGPDAANVDTIAASGVYTVSAGTGGTLPSPGLLGTLLHLERNSSQGRTQILADSSGVLWSRTTVFGTGAWRAWATITPGQATTSTQGIVELATSAESVTGTSPTLCVTPQGLSAAILASAPVGTLGQAWQDLTASRAANTTYTNSSGRAIEVVVMRGTSSGGANSSTFLIDGVQVHTISSSSTINVFSLTFTIPSGSTYRLNLTGLGSLVGWSELRT